MRFVNILWTCTLIIFDVSVFDAFVTVLTTNWYILFYDLGQNKNYYRLNPQNSSQYYTVKCSGKQHAKSSLIFD